MISSNDNEKPDFQNAMFAANSILCESRTISTFPFKVKSLIKELCDIKIVPMNKSLDAFHVNVDVIRSEDAALVRFEGYEIIFYNENKSKNRIKFSLLHELGHYCLLHDLDNKEIYDISEVETNFFAAQLLMPEQIINELRKRGKQINVVNLTQWFGVSREAAQKRIDTLRKCNYSKRSEEDKMLDEIILTKYSSFIDNIAPKNEYIYDVDYEEELQKERNSWLCR